MEDTTQTRSDGEVYMVLDEPAGPVGYWDINQGC
jgi:hypothetical protein